MDIIDIQSTPNPNALKFVVSKQFGGEFRSFARPEEAGSDPLASRIFALGDVASVFYALNFVTVTKTPAGSWERLEPAVSQILSESGEA